MTTMMTVLLASGAAFFYMAASWIMKSHGASPFMVLVPAVFITLAAGAWFETEVLRFSRLGHIIILILAIEVAMTFFVAILVLHERYTLREAVGVAVIVAGIALLSWSSETATMDTAPRGQASIGEETSA